MWGCLFMALAIGHRTPAYGQRRLPDSRGIQLSAGLVDGFTIIKGRSTAYNVGLAFSKYNQSGNKWLYGLEYLQKTYCYNCSQVPVVQFTAEAGYFHTLLSNRGKDVFLSAGIALMAGYETSNWGKKKFPDGATLLNEDSFTYGGFATVEVETFILDRLILLLSMRERVSFNSPVGKFHNQMTIGIKYMYKL
jgi:hypothetical protein